jgi:selenocysteine lyase/cysteine desulfurase
MNRNDFPMLNNDIYYFDNGATTLKPKSVIKAVLIIMRIIVLMLIGETMILV